MLIIIAALVPVFTLQSVEGRIFRPLALTYSFALIGALVFALTLVPALCAVLFGRGTPSFRSHPGSNGCARVIGDPCHGCSIAGGGFSPRHLSCRRWRC